MNLSQYMLISIVVIKIMYLCSSQMQTVWELITLLAYFAVSRNANICVHERLTNLLHKALECTFRKEKLLIKKMKI